MNKILLLEDDPLLAKTLVRFLTQNGYEVDLSRNGEEASELSYNNQYILYLFDINVPLFNGDDLLGALRNAGDNTPCILISALIDIASITKGFKQGADDYIKKPFEPNELLIRIKAKTNELKQFDIYQDYKVCLQTEKIFYQNKELILSNTKSKILKVLIKRYPNIVTKNEFMQLLETDNDLSTRVNITKIKQELNINIINIRGIGYKLD